MGEQQLWQKEVELQEKEQLLRMQEAVLSQEYYHMKAEVGYDEACYDSLVSGYDQEMYMYDQKLEADLVVPYARCTTPEFEELSYYNDYESVLSTNGYLESTTASYNSSLRSLPSLEEDWYTGESSYTGETNYSTQYMHRDMVRQQATCRK